MEGQRERQRMMPVPRIVIIGSGNVATSLAPALDAVANVVQVWSRNIDHARALTTRLRAADPINKAADIDLSADIAVIAVADDAVADTARMLVGFKGIVAHTSGSVPMDAIVPSLRRGVFYPLQTFSRQRPLPLDHVPFFIEGDTDDTTACLWQLAAAVSDKVYHADSQHRAALHVAAVFACNFSNYMWDVADNLLSPHGYDIGVFGPLLAETLQKALTIGPHSAQTGPAMRHDTNVINKHMTALPDHLAGIYSLLTNNIIQSHSNE